MSKPSPHLMLALQATKTPEFFDDALARRILPMRFRQIGNPFAFLNDVGIIPILEFIYKGNLLVDVAEVLNVSLTILRTWVENEGHQAAIDEAETVSAEGFLAEGQRQLRNAKTEFDLRRAKEIIRHAQFMATKKNKATYGTTEQTAGQGTGVSYVFNIGAATSAPLVKTVLEAVAGGPKEPPPAVTFDLASFTPIEHTSKEDTPLGAFDFSEATPKLSSGVKLDTDSPAPIGPFYDVEP